MQPGPPRAPLPAGSRALAPRTAPEPWAACGRRDPSRGGQPPRVPPSGRWQAAPPSMRLGRPSAPPSLLVLSRGPGGRTVHRARSAELQGGRCVAGRPGADWPPDPARDSAEVTVAAERGPVLLRRPWAQPGLRRRRLSPRVTVRAAGLLEAARGRGQGLSSRRPGVTRTLARARRPPGRGFGALLALRPLRTCAAPGTCCSARLGPAEPWVQPARFPGRRAGDGGRARGAAGRSHTCGRAPRGSAQLQAARPARGPRRRRPPGGQR